MSISRATARITLILDRVRRDDVGASHALARSTAELSARAREDAIEARARTHRLWWASTAAKAPALALALTEVARGEDGSLPLARSLADRVTGAWRAVPGSCGPAAIARSLADGMSGEWVRDPEARCAAELAADSLDRSTERLQSRALDLARS